MSSTENFNMFAFSLIARKVRIEMLGTAAVFPFVKKPVNHLLQWVKHDNMAVDTPTWCPDNFIFEPFDWLIVECFGLVCIAFSVVQVRFTGEEPHSNTRVYVTTTQQNYGYHMHRTRRKYLLLPVVRGGVTGENTVTPTCSKGWSDRGEYSNPYL